MVGGGGIILAAIRVCVYFSIRVAQCSTVSSILNTFIEIFGLLFLCCIYTYVHIYILLVYMPIYAYIHKHIYLYVYREQYIYIYIYIASSFSDFVFFRF